MDPKQLDDRWRVYCDTRGDQPSICGCIPINVSCMPTSEHLPNN